jgi:hypothetical protein
MLIGTSFQWQLLRDAGNSHRFGKMFMNYYDRLFVEWPKDVHTTVDRRSDSWRAAMLDNDLYILDLFEVYLLAPDTYVDEVLADLEPEVADDVEAPSSGAAITGMHDLGVTDGSHYFELWGTFPAGPASYTASVTCDGVRRPATVYYANPNAQQLNVQISDPGPGTCDHQAPPRASGVSCTFRVRRGQIGSPSFGPRKVCPAPQGETGQDPDGRCQLSFPGC